MGKTRQARRGSTSRSCDQFARSVVAAVCSSLFCHLFWHSHTFSTSHAGSILLSFWTALVVLSYLSSRLHFIDNRQCSIIEVWWRWQQRRLPCYECASGPDLRHTASLPSDEANEVTERMGEPRLTMAHCGNTSSSSSSCYYSCFMATPGLFEPSQCRSP